ncbi:hypothetical protein AKJ09_03177 [Labilithrix luteola]|uniref:Uncharacterized protein n=1 Tax=Labilithrix luteola TaxID=1391654 RepID=A0A0K1PSK1_9BACT|nr:hypothetical protein AKJ09_03177 [Labilithrix luteola]
MYLAGFLAAAITACTGAESSQPSTPSSSTNGDSDPPSTNHEASADGGFANGCSPEAPIRYVVGPIGDPFGPNEYDSCEPLPGACADAGLVNEEVSDIASTCDCVIAEKKKAINDAGETSCPGRGPVYCDVLEDGTLRLRCSPP